MIDALQNDGIATTVADKLGIFNMLTSARAKLDGEQANLSSWLNRYGRAQRRVGSQAAES